MRVAVIAITRGGKKLSTKLCQLLPFEIVQVGTKGIKPTVKKIWPDYDALIFIMATGIIVRAIAPLLEDNSARKDGTTLVNLGLSYPFGEFELGLDVLNLFDSGGHDIEYFYESKLINEALPVEDFHFHPVEPREFRFRVRYRF